MPFNRERNTNKVKLECRAVPYNFAAMTWTLPTAVKTYFIAMNILFF